MATPNDDPAPLVLLVDDSEDDRAMYAQYMVSAGWRVELAREGAQGTGSARELRPDVMVLDLWMPGVDGFEALRRLRADPATRDIPVLVLTGDSSEETRAAALDSGATDYVVKPCRPDDLVARIGQFLTSPPAASAQQ
jgi:DNA-binding response OmpR family regulator